MKKINILFGLLFTINVAQSQIKTKIYEKGIPQIILLEKASNINKVKTINPPEIFMKLKEDETKHTNIIKESLKFALPVKVNIDFISSAEQVVTKNEISYYLNLNCVAARNISLIFDKFILSPKAVLTIYTNNEITDSITSKENNVSKQWATRIYQGSIINLVLKIPSNEVGKSIINIDKVNFGYKKSWSRVWKCWNFCKL